MVARFAVTHAERINAQGHVLATQAAFGTGFSLVLQKCLGKADGADDLAGFGVGGEQADVTGISAQQRQKAAQAGR